MMKWFQSSFHIMDLNHSELYLQIPLEQ